jgi:uncharacterized protein
MASDLPPPQSNADAASYWQAASEERLLIRRCGDCGELHFMPRHVCPHCWSDQIEPVDASGRGVVHSFTVIRRASDPAFASLCPYVVALVDLEEGPRMMANILGADALNVAIGDPVEVLFETRGGTAKIPQFRRSQAGDPQ